jgi:hypothetical protein
LFVKDSKPHYVHNYFGADELHVTSSQPLLQVKGAHTRLVQRRLDGALFGEAKARAYFAITEPCFKAG